MRWFTALLLTGFSLAPVWASAQESVQDWSKKVIELQEKEGQNFELDLQLVKGFLYLQRRSEALTLINRLFKTPNKKDTRLIELYEAASDQFFSQETAELYADVLQLIRTESWAEAKDKVEAGLQKEPKHRLLTLRAIQVGLVLNQGESISGYAKQAESYFPDNTNWKIYSAWMSLMKSDGKEAHRVLAALWASERKIFEKTELAVLAYLQSIELTKHTADWIQLSKIIQKNPQWVAVRLWRLKNKNFAAKDRIKEIQQLNEIFSDLKKLKNQQEKQDRDQSYYFLGLISVDKTKLSFDEFQAPKPSGTN